MSTESDIPSKYSLKSDDQTTNMMARKEFCWGQLFGVFLFCGGFVGGILIGIYVYHGVPADEVKCKNIPEWAAKGDVTTQSPWTKTTLTPPPKTTQRFNYTINNQLEPPYFTETIELDIVQNAPLLYYMGRSVIEDPTRFKNFTATFKPSFQGFYIDAINDQWGYWFINQTWWAIWNGTGLTPLGVSKYIPVANDPILFNFTQGWIPH